MPSHASSSTTRRLLPPARAKSLYDTAAPRIAVTVLAMAGNDNLPISALRSGATKRAALLTAILILHALPPAAAQQPTANPAAANQDDPYNTNVSPALAILVVAIVSSFFLLGFFSVYLRRCTGDRSAVSPAAIAGMVGIGGGRSRRGAQKGLDSSVLETFPTMVYSAVKGQKLGKESLECAVCLCEFEDDDILRLLPRCSHVFHRDCIDIWLASHVTCPVCRSNLSITDDDPLAETDHVAVRVDDEGGEVLDGQDRQAELADLVRIGSQRREAAVRSRPGSVRTRPISSRSTVDWADVVEARGGGGGERFTLRLPDDLRRELLEAGKLRRSASFAVFPTRGEGSSRRGYREGMWRSLRIGRSGRWPFLGRNFSANGRGESAAAAEDSVFGSSKSVRVTPAPFGGLNGGGEKSNYDATSSTLTLKPV